MSMRVVLIRSAAYWRQRAEQARTKAEQMVDDEARGLLKEIADRYEKLPKITEAGRGQGRMPCP
jgi:C4-dicarboxylate-specific signal transduction histidine kinase